MKLRKLRVIYFSPNGTTKKTAQSIATGINSSYIEHDLTSFEARWDKIELSSDDLAIIALPVYAGRLPGICREFFRGIRANKTPAIIAAVYGNNQYGDALLELKDKCQEAGFLIVGAGAFPAEHCMNENIGAGRPDEKDMTSMRDFGGLVKERLGKISDCDNVVEIKLESHFPYNFRTFDLPISPHTTDDCVECGKCADICPVKAINPSNLFETDSMRCILCFKCVNECDDNARVFANEKMEKQMELVEKTSKSRKTPDLYCDL